VISPTDGRVVIVLTTLGADVDAASLARTLVEERLAACVNILPAMTSVYRWEGSVEEARERQLLIKTTADRVDMLESRLRALHPYAVPEFLVVPVAAGSDAYLAWLGESVSTRRP
jgi:periplasmic divalent cation tolerance protein